ncbi:MAG: hypothetical protein QXR48_03460 [Candidatus Woesearchaeota archaeon]
MHQEQYKKFWDIIADWRHYYSLLQTCHPQFRETAKHKLEYLTDHLKTIFKLATDRELQILVGYYGVLFPEWDYPEPNLYGEQLYKAIQSTTKKFDKIVCSQRITFVDDIE